MTTERIHRYATGRDYGEPQVLSITIPAIPASIDDFDFVPVRFVDAARSIIGTVQLCANVARDPYTGVIGPMVLREYDAGRYEEC